jgi:hypothetical protein
VSATAILVGALLNIAGCAASEMPARANQAKDAPVLVAVFPVENLSGNVAPLDDVRRLLSERMARSGFRVLDDAVLERIITKHRVRYTAGLEQGFAAALKDEAGVEAVVIPSLDLYEPGPPPRVGLFVRLISTGGAPTVRWIDGGGLAGDDAPGVLGLGLVADPRVLIAKVVDSLAASLARHVSEPSARPDDRSPTKFQPKLAYRAKSFDPGRAYSVAVVPFFNKTERRYAGDIVALHMMRSLIATGRLTIVEPGVVREELLRFRVIMTDGISLADTETVAGAVTADLVLNGEVLEYRDVHGSYGAPKVGFSVLFIERRSRRVLYSASSHNTGDDGVFFFDVGRVNTAHAIAAGMARAMSDRMLLVAPPQAPGPPLPQDPQAGFAPTRIMIGLHAEPTTARAPRARRE